MTTQSSPALTTRLSKAYQYLDQFGADGEPYLQRAFQIEDLPSRFRFCRASLLHIAQGIKNRSLYRDGPPVSPRMFVEHEDYLNQPNVLFPAVLECFDEMNSGRYVEAVLTGGIGTGKTTLAIFSTAYQLYKLSCYRNPQGEFGIAPSDEMMFVVQSLNKASAENAYDRLRALVGASPYFQQHFPFRGNLLDTMEFPNRLQVQPLSGSVAAAIGRNVFGGILDEVNYMAKVAQSKQSNDGGIFDQAKELYRSIRDRRESRFMIKGELPGMLALVSSKRYPGEFTERKAQEAAREIRENGSTKIYVYDKTVWEIKPEGAFSDERFQVFCGDESRKPYILRDEEKIEPGDEHLIVSVPLEYKQKFIDDIYASLRDIAGRSTYALNPFIPNAERMSEAFGKVVSILSREDCDFKVTKVKTDAKMFRNLDKPRFVHIDLSKSRDSTGVACGYVRRFVEVSRGGGHPEMMPEFVFDFILEVKPPKGEQIEYDRIRQMLVALRSLGLPIQWASFDDYQSLYFRQLLAKDGFAALYKSMDTDNTPYEFLKDAMMTSRVLAPKHERAQQELRRLEYFTMSSKIDHPPDGSKDCSDAMAGVIYGLMMAKHTWATNDQQIPAHLVALAHTMHEGG